MWCSAIVVHCVKLYNYTCIVQLNCYCMAHACEWICIMTILYAMVSLLPCRRRVTSRYGTRLLMHHGMSGSTDDPVISRGLLPDQYSRPTGYNRPITSSRPTPSASKWNCVHPILNDAQWRADGQRNILTYKGIHPVIKSKQTCVWPILSVHPK